MSKEHAQKRILTFQPLDREELSRFCSEESIRALDSSMSALVRGRAPTPSFKLYGKTDLTVSTEFLASIDAKSVPTWMLEYEKSRLAKWGPQGGHKPWKDLLPLFLLYYERIAECNIYPATVHKMCKKYSKLRCMKLALSSTLANLISTDKIQDRAAGWSTFELKKTNPTAQRVAITLARKGLWVNGKAYVFSRYNKLKLRIFMPMPFSSMLVQAQYYLEFIGRIQQDLLSKGASSDFFFWADKIGLNNGKMLELLNQRFHQFILQEDETFLWIQRDFEKMDTTCGPSQYSKVFIPIIAAAFGIKEGTPEYQSIYDVMQFTTECPIITPSGIIPEPHGTASGAEVTNGSETVLNESYDSEVDEELAIKGKHLSYRRVFSIGNGDDGGSLYIIKKTQILEFKRVLAIVANLVAKRHGYRMQAQKWHMSDEFGIYCQYMLWISNNMIHQAYPAVLILNAICNPEKQYTKATWDKDYRDLDIIAKLDNGYGLPYFHQLVDYVDKGMKFRLLGRSETETKRILSKYDSWRKLQDPSEYFNKRPFDVGSSPTIKYLLSKR